jgi:hypothetical protein
LRDTTPPVIKSHIVDCASNPVVNPTYGIVELQVNYWPNLPCHDFTGTVLKCPLQYYSPSLASNLQGQVSQLMSNWESVKGNSSIYNEAAMTTPGCMTTEFAE